VTERDLLQHRHLVVRETSERRDSQVSVLASEQRLTVSTMATRIQALCQGLGFAWTPALKIQRELEAGLLKPLQLKHDASRYIEMYMFFADEDGAGPATRALAEAIRQQAILYGSG
jgi:DNA-binding transcriptional LysR family regulator